jgi:hypothetical protein
VATKQASRMPTQLEGPYKRRSVSEVRPQEFEGSPEAISPYIIAGGSLYLLVHLVVSVIH